jgi:hypothetical protein
VPIKADNPVPVTDNNGHTIKTLSASERESLTGLIGGLLADLLSEDKVINNLIVEAAADTGLVNHKDVADIAAKGSVTNIAVNTTTLVPKNLTETDSGDIKITKTQNNNTIYELNKLINVANNHTIVNNETLTCLALNKSESAYVKNHEITNKTDSQNCNQISSKDSTINLLEKKITQTNITSVKEKAEKEKNNLEYDRESVVSEMIKSKLIETYLKRQKKLLEKAIFIKPPMFGKIELQKYIFIIN